jgi:hypothetical protein
LARSRIERDDAYKIAEKIGAEVQRAGKHARATLRMAGRLVLTFGIRHGPNSGHGHLCGANGDLKMNEANVVALARCTMTKEQYFDLLREKGVLPSPAPPSGPKDQKPSRSRRA